jgi:transposase
MSRGDSFDLRKRVIALVEGGISRRAAARQLLVSESSSIKWFRRYKETGSFAEKPGKKLRPSPLDAHAEWLLALVASESDLTLAEIEVRLLDVQRRRSIAGAPAGVPFLIRTPPSAADSAATQQMPVEHAA